MMKTTVSATFLMILAAYECSAQQDYWQLRFQLQPLWSYAQQNPGVQPQQQYAGVAAAGNQPQTNHQNQGGQNPLYAQPPTNAAGYANDRDPSNPSWGQQQPGSKSTTGGVWHTPDPRVPESTTPVSRTTSRSRPKYTKSTEAPSDVTTPSKRWPTQTKPLLGLAVDAFARPSSTRPAPRPVGPLKPISASAPPTPSDDRVVFEPPGGNTPGSMLNSLDVVDRPDSSHGYADDAADLGADINKGLRQFALNMLKDMTDAAPNQNVVFSPYSVWAVMLVIYEGAEGQTARQIAKTLMFKDRKPKVRSNYKRLEFALQKANNESHSTFVSGNGIFYDGTRPPMPDFQRFAYSDYQCQLQPVDFTKPLAAVKIINDWVSEVTHNRIKMLVKPEDITKPELIITNALFFKGQWKIPFNLTATHTDKFYNENKRHIADVRMMYQKGEYMYSFIAEIGAHVLDMPYEDSKFRMLVVLPKPSSTVAEVLQLMKAFPVDQCYERLVREQEMFAEDEVHVYLPRFKFGNRVELRPNLERLGITDVFNSAKANLTSMSHLQLYLGKVFHVSEIEVTEEGTVASAATAGVFVNKMGPPKFLANRPFAYFIVENSQKTVIFAGKVADPTKRAY